MSTTYWLLVLMIAGLAALLCVATAIISQKKQELAKLWQDYRDAVFTNTGLQEANNRLWTDLGCRTTALEKAATKIVKLRNELESCDKFILRKIKTLQGMKRYLRKYGMELRANKFILSQTLRGAKGLVQALQAINTVAIQGCVLIRSDMTSIKALRIIREIIQQLGPEVLDQGAQTPPAVATSGSISNSNPQEKPQPATREA